MRRDIRLRQIKPETKETKEKKETKPKKRVFVKRKPSPTTATTKEIPTSQKPGSKGQKFRVVRKSFKKVIPLRKLDSAKWDYGHVLLLVGSQRMAGAGIISTRASLRMGSGMVTAGIPLSINSVFKISIPEALTVPLSQSNENTVARDAYKALELEKYNAIAVGPGLTRNTDTLSFIRHIIEKAEVPLVIDGDGLFALKGNLHYLTRKKKPVVLTPHVREMAYLTGKSEEEIQKHRDVVAVDFAKKHNVICVLKGQKTLVASANGLLYRNTTGNPAMATAGSGDVLTGMIVSLLGQGMESFDATTLAVYLHGLTGDLAKKDRTETCVIASDLIKYLPLAIRTIL